MASRYARNSSQSRRQVAARNELIASAVAMIVGGFLAWVMFFAAMNVPYSPEPIYWQVRDLLAGIGMVGVMAVLGGFTLAACSISDMGR
jgi:predicted lysophospholipase L1 biosynthesis ABC-type transport system permease subunit